MTLYRFFQAVSAFLGVLRVAILIHWFLTLFNARNAVVDWLGMFIQPFVSPFRQLSLWLMRKTNVPLDFSYFFSLIGLTVINRLWWALYALLRGVR